MTREEAIECLKYIHSCLDMTYINEQEHKSLIAVDMAIKALEQEPVLDKIRAEIDVARYIDKDTRLCKNANASGLEVAMQIIDKYKSESEPQESEG